ncbi:rust resistance kinase Lr10 [Arachis duranensis]|uniref:Rust resistance kinase Lr10 n=1 Tax=Arachis duranensis TaxID=130453 RepID=A0A6P4BS76_ARADU|nr:rust resistance kinase Lr10 [Arachis duranensis]
MDFSLIGVLFMFCFNVELALASDTCQVLSCGNQEIRFPFRIKGRQPQNCGYPGFDLVCTDSNETLIELHDSLNFSVNKIDYRKQTIELSYPHNGCFPRLLHSLKLSASPFNFNMKADDYYGDYYFFNCSALERDYMEGYFIQCLSTSASSIYAIPSSSKIEYLPLSFCTKMFNVSSVPRIFVIEDAHLHLKWSEPDCGHCESKGNRCSWNRTKNEFSCLDNHKGPSTALVTTGSVLGSFFLILLTGAIYYIYDTCIIQKEKEAIIEKFLEDYRAQKPTRYSYAEIKRITNNFGDKLGEGAYGTVFKGSISKEFTVAVKMLNNSQGNGEEFVNEVGIIGKIHHVNIVRLVGFCADGFRRALIYEFLPNSSLQKFINSPDNKQNFLGWKKLQEIALGVAKGIEYLHQGCDQRILHFDIKPQNVLLDHNFTPKICDFGLAKLCSKDQSVVSMTAARGTLGYIAPEVFSRNFGNVSYKSDVYSYGMMLLETIGGKKITEDVEENSSHIYYPEWIHNLLEEKEEMRIHIEDEGDAKIAKQLATVGLWCIQWHAVDRPSMQTVLQMLEGDQDTLPIPPNPFASTGPSRKYSKIGVPARQIIQDLEVIQELD